MPRFKGRSAELRFGTRKNEHWSDGKLSLRMQESGVRPRYGTHRKKGYTGGPGAANADGWKDAGHYPWSPPTDYLLRISSELTCVVRPSE